MAAIGVDIGGTNLRAVRIGPTGEILARAKAASSADATAVLAAIERLIREVDAPDVAAIGIGVPGRVDFAAQTVLSGGFVDLSSVPVAEHIAQAFGRPVVVDNDCNMALLGEAACGAARGRADVVMLTIGTGIGGAILSRGKILRGRNTAGQLGHLAVDPSGEPCVCGGRGCVETLSSGTALGRYIAAAGLPRETTAASLLTAAAGGDATAATVLRSWVGPLRQAIDNLIATLDPEIVLLGGGLGQAATMALSLVPSDSHWYHAPIAAASLGDDAGAIGAGLAALARIRPAGKRLVLVNGIPASGKSRVAQELSAATGWPVYSLDTVKNPFLAHLTDVDRLLNRTLGKASYEAIFSLIGAAPAGTTAIVDAWFGFQPQDLLESHLAAAGVTATAEIWCHAPPQVLADRYAARLDHRLPGHPGAEYIPELIALAGRAAPLERGPMRRVETTTPADIASLAAWLAELWPAAGRPASFG